MFAKHKITTFCAPPTMYRMLIKDDLSKYDLSSIEYATTAGEALNPEVFHQFKKATGLSIMEGFGQTETTLSLANLVGTTPKVGSMGNQCRYTIWIWWIPRAIRCRWGRRAKS
jgi:acetyl-CoA synthetase